MTPQTRAQLGEVVRMTERLGALSGLVMIALLTVGFRIERPGDRVAKLEFAVDSLRKENRRTSEITETMYRLQCLALSRREAQLAGACSSYPTRDESTRVYAPPGGSR